MPRPFTLLLLTALACPPAVAAPADPGRHDQHAVRIERGFTTVDGLQVHHRVARPVDADAVTRPPVLCLHQSPNSSQVFVEFMGEMARDRVVYAPDTPGYGESDRPAEPPAIEDYARWLGAFSEAAGVSSYDLVGYHTGASIAVEIARQRPTHVRHLLLVGVAAFEADEVENLLANPWPRPAPLGEIHLAEEWRSSKKWQGPGQSDRSVERTFLAKLSAGPTGWWGPRAVFTYPVRERLAALAVPVTLVRPRDDLWDITPRARAARPDARWVELPDHGFGVFEAIPGRMADIAREAFDGEAD